MARLIAFLALLCAGPALAQDKPDAKQIEALLEKYACSACHQTDAKVLGPSWKEVAAKYKDKGNAEAPAKLVDSVKKGSSGTWGPVPMPANAAVSDADAKALIGWILAQ